MLDFFQTVFIYFYKYAWFIILILILASALLLAIMGAINKYRLVKKEREKESKLIKMSYEDENKKSVGKRVNIDEETPKNKKYCSVCHALVNKRDKVCPVCKNVFKDI